MCIQGIPLQVVLPYDGLLLQSRSSLFHVPVLLIGVNTVRLRWYFECMNTTWVLSKTDL
jgi:hypothetical protein